MDSSDNSNIVSNRHVLFNNAVAIKIVLNRSCHIKSRFFFYQVASLADCEKVMHIMHFDFNKVFDKKIDILISILVKYELDGLSVRWIPSWLNKSYQIVPISILYQSSSPPGPGASQYFH